MFLAIQFKTVLKSHEINILIFTQVVPLDFMF